MPEINLVDFFKYYENQPQQAEASAAAAEVDA